LRLLGLGSHGFKQHEEGLLMSSDVAIRVEQLSKAFRTYSRPGKRLTQMLWNGFSRVTPDPASGWFKTRGQSACSEFWALRDISFIARKGETTAILGKNGAGKSTLLQLIAGTLAPTTGSMYVNGKISAILELGAGFNQDYTGRENVLLNGQLMGLDERLLREKLPEIERFADIGQFFDQPTRTYSTGMYARLAFAVSTCLEPEVLIVDEALAVGDIGFQYKCFQRLRELKDRGVSILLVTHSTAMVLDHADHAILLHQGNLIASSGDVKAVVTEYEKIIRGVRDVPNASEVASPPMIELAPIQTQNQLAELAERNRNTSLSEHRFGSWRAILDSIVVSQEFDARTDSPLLESGANTTIRFLIISSELIENVVLGASIRNVSGSDLWGDNNLYAGVPITIKPGLNILEYEFELALATGEYLLLCGLARYENGQREEIDQRWPVKRLHVTAHRDQVGAIYSPIRVRCFEVGEANS